MRERGLVTFGQATEVVPRVGGVEGLTRVKTKKC